MIIKILAERINMMITINKRLKRSFEFQDTIIKNVSTREDDMFMHILDCIGSLSCIRADQKKHRSIKDDGHELISSKYRVFWQAIREIADREITQEGTGTKEKTASISDNMALNYVLRCFPDESKRSDGRTWLPLHFAMSLPTVSMVDVQTLFAANPASIKAHTSEDKKLNPCHLAAMMKNPQIEVIRQLQIYYPRLGSSLAYDSNTPLHLAAMYSHSVALVRELAQLRPAALEMKNDRGNTPLHLAAMTNPIVELVRELAQLHPAALEVKDYLGNTPLHCAVLWSGSVAMVRELAQLCPAALEMKNNNGCTPIFLAVEYSGSAEIVRELAQLGLAALEMTNNNGETPLYAVARRHSGKTEMLQVLSEAAPRAARIAIPYDNCLPLHEAISSEGSSNTIAMLLTAYRDAVNIHDNDGWLPIDYAAQVESTEILKMIAEENMSNLSVILPSDGSVAHMAADFNNVDNLRYIYAMMPELLLSVDGSNRTPLHALIDEDDVDESFEDLSCPVSAASDVLRFLLRHCPSLASAKDSDDNSLYDRLPADNPGLFYARRLLLLAGASSLYPGVLQEMNYAARRAALLLFYSSATKPSIFSRIRHAAGGPVLMREIVTFL